MLKVWIDQDLCTGDGLCEEIAPSVFAMLDDGLAYVKDGDKILSDPGGADAVAPVPEDQIEGRMELQMPEYQKKKLAHTTIDNDGDLPELYTKLELFWGKLNIN